MKGKKKQPKTTTTIKKTKWNKKKNPNQTLNTSTIPLGLLHFPEAETEDRITPQIPRDTLTP